MAIAIHTKPNYKIGARPYLLVTFSDHSFETFDSTNIESISQRQVLAVIDWQLSIFSKEITPADTHQFKTPQREKLCRVDFKVILLFENDSMIYHIPCKVESLKSLCLVWY